MNKILKISLIITSVSLFVFNYQICSYFHPYDTDESIKAWWLLKADIYAVIIVLCFLTANIGQKGVLRFIVSIGIGLTLSSVIDKWYFDVREFTKTDIYMIIVTVLISGYDWYKTSKYYKK